MSHQEHIPDQLSRKRRRRAKHVPATAGEELRLEFEDVRELWAAANDWWTSIAVCCEQN
jgi:hypothetical protein